MEHLQERLPGGEMLAVEVRLNRDFGPTPENAAVRDFIVQPDQPWFSIAEREWLWHVLRGDFTGSSFDAVFVGRLDGRIAGALWYATHVNAPAVGVFGYVLTEPAHRGKGVSSALTSIAVRHFLDRGGRLLYLGTGNPIAHHIYEKCGFRDYNGHVMRLSASPGEPAALDVGYFCARDDVNVRRAVPGDYARLTALYVSPDTWFTRDFREGLFNDPTHPQVRCNSCWAAIALRSRSPSDAQFVMETASGAIVGIATQTQGGAPPVKHQSEVELLVYPGYYKQAGKLISRLIEHARRVGIETLVCLTASCDEDKIRILTDMNFGVAAVIEDYFRVGTDRFAFLSLRCNI